MRDLLKFITCGSVDDGKSTLIGHLLYDSKLIYADQLRALELDSKVGSRGGKIDYSLLLDGLAQEREQGITIDVAYRYFTTEKRSFICADTPGHEQYTRNMAVGASFADLAVILVDASQGVLVQTRRHARICSLVGIRSFVFAINKMDLVDYKEDVFSRIENDIMQLVSDLGLQQVCVIPVSATEGDNVTHISKHTPWYTGSPLLAYLEDVDIDRASHGKGFYMPVQRVSRPDHTFRGFQGQIEASHVSVGDEVQILPSFEKAHVKSILVAGASSERAEFGQAVTLQLDREVDVSRGCVIEKGSGLKVSSSIIATLLWMDDKALHIGSDFYAKLGTKEIPALLTEILYAVDVNTGEQHKVETLKKNEIAVVRLDFTDAVVVDEFICHRTMGELILIDRISNATAAAGIVERVDDAAQEKGSNNSQLRMVMKGQEGISVEFDLKPKTSAHINGPGFSLEEIRSVERELVVRGRDAYVYVPEADSHPLEVIEHLNRAGIIVLLAISDATVKKLLKAGDKLVLSGWQNDVGSDTVSIADYVERMCTRQMRVADEGSYI